jgi:hypothetical protein
MIEAIAVMMENMAGSKGGEKYENGEGGAEISMWLRGV